MDFFRSGSSSSAPTPPPAAPTQQLAPKSDATSQKEAMMQQVRQELALANAQELMNKINEKCYQRCIPKPGTSISMSEEGCLSRCMDRYMEAFNVISRTYYERIARERREAEFKD